MWTFISVSLALGINFYSPEIPENKKSMVINKNYYQRIGFPYQYFPGEFLSEEEVHYRLRLIYIYLMFGVSTSLPLTPSAAVMLPPPPVHRISPYALDSIRAQNKKNLRYIPVIRKRADKVMFSDKEIERFDELTVKWNSGSISMKELIFELRGGDGLTDVVLIIAFVIFVNWYDSLFGVEAFKATPLTHMDPIGWASGKYDSRNAVNPQCLSNQPSRFERETLQTMKQMCAASDDENGFVMDYDQAYNLINETYPGFMQITGDCRFSDWQGAKKAYHGQKGFGIDLDKYENISKEDLLTLQNTEGGLIPYVQKGGKLPPIEFILDFQQKIHDFCHLENTEVIRDAKHYGTNTGETPCIMFFNRETRQIVLFNQTSGDLITAEKFRQNYFNKCVDSGQIGNPKN